MKHRKSFLAGRCHPRGSNISWVPLLVLGTWACVPWYDRVAFLKFSLVRASSEGASEYTTVTFYWRKKIQPSWKTDALARAKNSKAHWHFGLRYPGRVQFLSRHCGTSQFHRKNRCWLCSWFMILLTVFSACGGICVGILGKGGFFMVPPLEECLPYCWAHELFLPSWKRYSILSYSCWLHRSCNAKVGLKVKL